MKPERDRCNRAWHFWKDICACSLSQGDSITKANSEECGKVEFCSFRISLFDLAPQSTYNKMKFYKIRAWKWNTFCCFFQQVFCKRRTSRGQIKYYISCFILSVFILYLFTIIATLSTKLSKCSDLFLFFF